MIKRTAKELIKNARYLAGLRNSDLTDFYTNTLLLNNAYTTVYIDAIQHGNVFTKTVDLYNEDSLPADCFQINRVTYCGADFVDYEIRNNILYTDVVKPLTITYSTTPATLTAPDDMAKLNITGTDFLLTDDYLYYTNNNVQYKLDLETLETEETTSYSVPDTFEFCDKTLSLKDNQVVDSDGVVYWKDVSYFNASGNYAFVSFMDSTIRVYFDLYNYADFNANISKGRQTKGFILTSCVDESTGKGVIYQDTSGNIYYASFVPDTILEWPNNTLYQLIEYKLAAILLGLTGLDSSAIEKQYKELLTYFYKTINIDNSKTYRIKKCDY